MNNRTSRTPGSVAGMKKLVAELEALKTRLAILDAKAKL